MPGPDPYIHPAPHLPRHRRPAYAVSHTATRYVDSYRPYYKPPSPRASHVQSVPHDYRKPQGIKMEGAPTFQPVPPYNQRTAPTVKRRRSLSQGREPVIQPRHYPVGDGRDMVKQELESSRSNPNSAPSTYRRPQPKRQCTVAGITGKVEDTRDSLVVELDRKLNFNDTSELAVQYLEQYPMMNRERVMMIAKMEEPIKQESAAKLAAPFIKVEVVE